MKEANTKLLLSLIAMFLFGGVSGALLEGYSRPFLFSPPPPDQMEESLMSFLGRRLHLLPGQQETIHPIVSDFVHRTESLRLQSLRQFRDLSDETDNRISEVLTPDQKGDWAKLRKERDEDLQTRGGMPGQPPSRLPSAP